MPGWISRLLRLMVRDGHAPERRLQTGIGPLEVRRPKVRARGVSGEGPIRLAAAIPPACLRRTRNLEELRPGLHVKGLSTGQLGEAPRREKRRCSAPTRRPRRAGSGAPGLSASTVRRLTEGWQEEHARRQRRDRPARGRVPGDGVVRR